MTQAWIAQDLMALYDRDLNKLASEILAYPDDASLWALRGEIKNPGGNLCLHVNGNLNTFLGQVLLQNAYVRDREAEFATRHGTRQDLAAQTLGTLEVVSKTLQTLDAPALADTYPLEVLGYPMTTGFFLLHLYGHLNWHLGQINYHRRLL